jgi:hypothetical protein
MDVGHIHIHGYPVDPWMSWRVFLVVVVAWEANSDLGE